jgi:biopolymer transport protein ExbD
MKLRLPAAEEDDEIDITPMIDCVFLLVLFFMVTSSFIEEAQAFKVTLPQAEQSETIAREKVDSVTLTIDGKYFFRSGGREQKEIDNLDALVKQLQERDAESRDRPVIIRCDARCEYQKFIQVKNALKLAGVKIIFEEVEVRHDKAKS